MLKLWKSRCSWLGSRFTSFAFVLFLLSGWTIGTVRAGDPSPIGVYCVIKLNVDSLGHGIWHGGSFVAAQSSYPYIEQVLLERIGLGHWAGQGFWYDSSYGNWNAQPVDVVRVSPGVYQCTMVMEGYTVTGYVIPQDPYFTSTTTYGSVEGFQNTSYLYTGPRPGAVSTDVNAFFLFGSLDDGAGMPGATTMPATTAPTTLPASTVNTDAATVTGDARAPTHLINAWVNSMFSAMDLSSDDLTADYASLFSTNPLTGAALAGAGGGAFGWFVDPVATMCTSLGSGLLAIRSTFMTMGFHSWVGAIWLAFCGYICIKSSWNVLSLMFTGGLLEKD